MTKIKDKYQLLFGNFKLVIYCIAFLVGITLGILTPLVSTHMVTNKVGSIWIGAVSSSYFLFIAITSVFIYKKMLNKNFKNFILAGLMLTAICAILFPLLSNLFVWFLLMSLMGVGISFYMIGTQTILHNLSDEATRGTVSGLYSLSFTLGCILSSVGGPIIYEKAAWIPFLVGGISLVLASLIIMFRLKGSITIQGYPKKRVFHKITLALSGVFVYSFIEATLVSLFPVFLLNQKYNYVQLGYSLGSFVVGSILGTIAITVMADKIGREKLLAISACISVAGLIGIILIDNYTLRIIISMIAGIGIGPIYPLTMAIMAHILDKDELPSGTSLFTFSYGIASTVGPILSSLIVYTLGFKHLFSLSLLFFFVFIIQTGISIKVGTVTLQHNN